MAAMTATILHTRGLSRSFGGVRAVDNVDLDLEEGEIRAIIGPNGAGKTSFVSLICGRIANDSGEVWLEGQDISQMPAHQRVRLGIGYTFQITSIFPNLTLLENVALAVQSQARTNSFLNLSSRKLNDGAHEALVRVGLGERSGELAGNLAYGHQRLLEVAMGIALKPRVLILDEPTQGLSESETQGFITLIRQIAATTTILLIEHNMDVVMALAEKITVMDQGRVLAEGTPAAIRANADVQRAYLGEQP